MPNPDGDPLAITADQSADARDKELWGFRRILARGLHEAGAFDSDITLVNWPLNDYWLRPALEIDGHTGPDDVARAHHEAKQLSLSVLYWPRTEAPRADGGTGFPGLKLRHDVTGTADGLAKSAYVRESRRIKAVTTVTEQDVSLDVLGPHGRKRHADSVGIGSYRIDLHPSTSGDNYVDVASVPFEIPLGALLPRRVRNLVPGAKNIGTTHITNGCYRLHPVEWNVGEVAGHLGGFALRRGVGPHQVRDRDPPPRRPAHVVGQGRPAERVGPARRRALVRAAHPAGADRARARGEGADRAVAAGGCAVRAADHHPVGQPQRAGAALTLQGVRRGRAADRVVHRDRDAAGRREAARREVRADADRVGDQPGGRDRVRAGVHGAGAAVPVPRPLNVFGLGAGVAGVLVSGGIYPMPAVVGLMASYNQMFSVSDPTSTQTVWSAQYAGVRPERAMIPTLPYTWVVALGGMILTAVLYLP
ncbi:FAD-dependent oxidoreductase [Amycolatopsis methanolica]|uniref:Fumarate reductase/succinate dehydrogenase flavoprotein domain-containing protein n=1 Tax=Amycolatopsis methanolica 239 TaxID=1068978 RepID=A0A076MXH3_AMYME|nr:FAD-dependent oxidoreductase [Amycolatopsis methanolica]AIJ23425.1 fumarate reductase/succinate dehydrogenase flavoprotein domain-containing protein [Amycolatopsis methanolica 239]